MQARKFRESMSYALAGIMHTWRTQRNFRLHILTGSLTITASIFLKLTPLELLFLVSAIFSVLVMELINTAIETTVDLVTREFHPLAFIAKNVGAAAVLLSALYALVVGLVLFGGRIINFF
jgi:diacylglycerol kinase